MASVLSPGWTQCILGSLLALTANVALSQTTAGGSDASASWSGPLPNGPRILGHTTLVQTVTADCGSPPCSWVRDDLWVYGGRAHNATGPSSDTYRFNTETLTWHLLDPAGEGASLCHLLASLPLRSDKPLGRMFHSADLSTSGEAMIVYGGLNCFGETRIRTKEIGPVSYEFANQNIEYQYAMEDMWVMEFSDMAWVEMNAARTKYSATCPPPPNVQPIWDYV